MKGRLTTVLIAMLMVLAGPAMAWQGYERVEEPNTDFDRTGGFMHQEAAGSHTDQKIYFDAYLMENGYPVPGSVNPNVPGSRLVPPTWYQNYAILGFWVDCNGDNFIGSALTGQRAYVAEFEAVDETKCPENSPYNNGFQVDEFRFILRGNTENNDRREADWDLIFDEDDNDVYDRTWDPYDIVDPDAMVWGDWMTPDGDAVPSQGIIPLPPKTLSTYHGHFKYVDDATLGDLSARLAEHGVDWYSAPEALGEHADVYLGPKEGDSPLAYVRYGYNDSTSEEGGTHYCGGAGDQACEGAYSNPIITVFDCRESAEGQGYKLENHPSVNTTGGDPRYEEDTTYIAAPVRVGTVNPYGSVDGTMKHNTRGAPLYYREYSDGERCSRSGTGVGYLTYGNLELPSQDSDVNAVKVNSDFNYQRSQEWNHRFRDTTGLPNDIAYPQNGYCDEHTLICFYAGGGYWYDNKVYSRRPPRATWGVTDTLYVTNYANVGDVTFVQANADAAAALPAKGSDGAKYGSEQCSDFAAGVESSTGTWSCDPEAWNPDTRGRVAYVGDVYDLRDEDCYDGSLQPGVKFVPTDDC